MLFGVYNFQYMLYIYLYLLDSICCLGVYNFISPCIHVVLNEAKVCCDFFH